jgi:hypothetical protein
MRRVARLYLLLTPVPVAPGAHGRDVQQVLEYIGAHNPVLRAQRVVTAELGPPSGWVERAKEYTLGLRAGRHRGQRLRDLGSDLPSRGAAGHPAGEH